jgi:hypothetical protein
MKSLDFHWLAPLGWLALGLMLLSLCRCGGGAFTPTTAVDAAAEQLDASDAHKGALAPAAAMTAAIIDAGDEKAVTPLEHDGGAPATMLEAGDAQSEVLEHDAGDDGAWLRDGDSDAAGDGGIIDASASDVDAPDGYLGPLCDPAYGDASPGGPCCVHVWATPTMGGVLCTLDGSRWCWQTDAMLCSLPGSRCVVQYGVSYCAP